jgi:uncharacterized protein YndB with AHSA1/START domain
VTDDELVYVRSLAADRQLVFACMTEPEHLAAFWGPEGTATPLDGIVVELHPGGRFETLMVNIADGTTYLMRARFERVEPPELLSWIDVDSGMSSTLSYRDITPGRTELTIRQRHVPEAFRAPQARAGFATSLDRLDRHLRELTRKDS